MTQIRWITKAGTLGTIPEGRFYKLPLEAAGPSEIGFRLVAGRLPQGVQVKPSGALEGVPEAVAITQGVPLSVNENVISKFTVRAFLLANPTVIADRTFSITVTGQDAPRFVTPAGRLGAFLDSTRVSIPIAVEDDDNESLVIRVAGGALPAGLRIDGRSIVGVIEPPIDLSDQGVAVPAPEDIAYLDSLPIERPKYSDPWVGQDLFDLNRYDAFNFAYSTLAIDKNYQFTLEVTDGKEFDRRQYSIFVMSRNNVVEGENLAALYGIENHSTDWTQSRPPFILTPSNLGRYRHDNFISIPFEVVDFDGEQVALEIVDGLIPEFVDQNQQPAIAAAEAVFQERHILQGYVPDILANEVEYTFWARAYKVANPDIWSPEYEFKIVIYGDADVELQWLSPAYLGEVTTGYPSTLSVSATSGAGLPLAYRTDPNFVIGKYRRDIDAVDPLGITLLPSGEIAGLVRLQQFMVDGGTTTFDSDLYTRREINPTTFDHTFTVPVTAYSVNPVTRLPDGQISSRKVFTFTVRDSSINLWENVYAHAMPDFKDRATLERILKTDPAGVFASDLIYRKDDHNFGVTSGLRYGHAYGLTSSDAEQYASALTRSHYKKHLVLGEVKLAVAKDANDQVMYEVIYSEIVDSLVDSSKRSISSRVTQQPVANRPTDANGEPVTGIYPNSLDNMRNRLFNVVGTEVVGLPQWMLSKQRDGRVIGYVAAWPIAYAQPGRGAELLYKFKEAYEAELNEIDFYIDRFVVDKELTYIWAYASSEAVFSPVNSYERALVTEPIEIVPFWSVAETPIVVNATYAQYDRGRVVSLSAPAAYKYGNGDINNKYLMFPQQGIFK